MMRPILAVVSALVFAALTAAALWRANRAVDDALAELEMTVDDECWCGCGAVPPWTTA